MTEGAPPPANGPAPAGTPPPRDPGLAFLKRIVFGNANATSDDMAVNAVQRVTLGCTLPIAMGVLAVVGTFGLTYVLNTVLPRPGPHRSDEGQGEGIVLGLLVLATPLFGIFAAFFPRTGVAFALTVLLAFFALIIAAHF